MENALKISSSPAESASCNSLKNEKVCPLDAYRLRPYQIEIITAVMESVHKHKGITFSVEIARRAARMKSQRGCKWHYFAFSPTKTRT